MPVRPLRRLLHGLLLLPVAALLSGCNMVVMRPAGDIALRQRDLIIASTALMLLIIVPVIAATLFFAWRYRQSNTEAQYDPDWHHSTHLEVLIWSAPLVIIIALGALTWISTHTLDPYRPLSRLDAARPLPEGVKPITVEVVALDWKWLFFYPDQGFATVNELAAPVDVPVTFKITSATMMNSFFIPALAGQVYAMAGMETKLHAVINRQGVYEGLSANYSGSGFSRMTFKFHGLSREGFDQWAAKVKADGSALTREAYLKLEKPSEQEPVRYFSTVDQGLYGSVLNMCAVPGKMCMNEMMHIDAKGGAGMESHENRERLEYDHRHATEGHEAPSATFPASGRPARGDVQPEGMKPDSLDPKVHEAPDAGHDGHGASHHEGHGASGAHPGHDHGQSQDRPGDVPGTGPGKGDGTSAPTQLND